MWFLHRSKLILTAYTATNAPNHVS